jgi:hypothetical protein
VALAPPSHHDRECAYVVAFTCIVDLRIVICSALIEHLLNLIMDCIIYKEFFSMSRRENGGG